MLRKTTNMKSENNKKCRDELILFGINTMIIFLTLGLFVMNKHLSSDDFVCYYNQSEEASAVTYSSYRVVLGWIYNILNAVNINVVKYQIPIGCLMLLSFSIAVSLMTKMCCSLIHCKQENRLLIISINIACLMIVINGFISEWLWFSVGYIQWGMSILFSTLSAIYIVKNENLIKNFLIALLCAFVSAGCYQVAIAIYVFEVMFYISYSQKYKISLSTVKMTIKAAVVAVLAILFNIIITKVMVACGWGYSGSRVSIGIQSIMSKFAVTLMNIVNIYVTGMNGILPRYFLIIVLLAYIAFIVFVSVKLKRKWNPILLIVSLFAGIIVMCAPVLLQEVFWQPARMVVPLMAIFTVLHLVATEICKNEKRYLIGVILGGICVLGVNFYAIQENTIDCIKTNAIQEKEIHDIDNYLRAYEEKNNTSILKVAFINDQYITYKFYREIKNGNYSGEMATRAIWVDWANLQMLNYYSNRNLNKVSAYDEEDIKMNFKKENYDYFSPAEQIYIKDDTAYIYVY